MKAPAILALALALPLCAGAQELASTNPTETADMKTTGKTPATVYFYSMNAQLKALIDRTVSRWTDFGRFKGTEFWLVVTAADENKDMMEPTLAGLRGFMRDCMEGSIERGVLYGTGAYEKGAIKALPVYQEAYEAGRNT